MSTRTLTSSKQSNIDKLTFIGLCILLFYPPFFRGLFFQKELLITHIITFALFSIWLISKLKSKDFTLLNSLTDFLALGIVLMYFISIFYGVNKRLAVAEFLKYANYFVIYILVRYFTNKDDSNIKTLINVLIASGVVVSIIGIGSAIGTFIYNGAFVGGRINSTFQYPNTLASYLIALFILSIGMLQSERKSKKKYFYVVTANIYIFTFIPTFSRGMWLLAPIVLFLYFIIVPKDKKLQTIIDYIITILPALIFSTLFVKYLEQKLVLILWGSAIFSVLLSLVLLYIFQKFLTKINLISYKTIMYVVIGLVVILSLLIVIALNFHEPLTLSNMESDKDTWKYVDRPIANILQNKEYRLETEVEIQNPDNKPYAGRIIIYSIDDTNKTEQIFNQNINETGKLILNFNTKENTESIRIRFINYYQNTAIKFFNAAVFDNETGEKINDLKLKYKFIPERIVSRFYGITSSERSVQGRLSFYRDAFKVIKDYPVFGAGGGAWQTLYFKYQSYMYWTTQAHNYFLQLWIETGIIGFLIYMSLVILLMLNLIKLLNSDNEENKVAYIAISIAWISILAHSVIDFDLSLGAISILLWCLYGLSYQNTLVKKQFMFRSNVFKYSVTVIVVLLLISSSSLYIGQVYGNEAVKSAKNKDVVDMMRNFEKASKFDPFTSNYLADLSTAYYVLSKNDKLFIEKSHWTIEKALKLDPYNSKILMKAGELYLQTGNFNKGIEYIEKAVEVQPMNLNNYENQAKIYLSVANYFIKKNDKKGIEFITDKIQKMMNFLNETSQKALQPLGYDKELNLNLQKLDYIIDYKNDLIALKKVNNIALYNKFKWDLNKDGFWDRSFLYNPENGELTIDNTNKDSITLHNNGKNCGVLMFYDMNLEKNEEYIFKLDYKSNLNPNDLDIYIYDDAGKSKVIASFENLEKQDKFTIKEFEFKTPENIEKGKQRLGIIHRGNGGKIEIRKVLIMKND